MAKKSPTKHSKKRTSTSPTADTRTRTRVEFSSKGQVTIPAELRRRFGFTSHAPAEAVETPDGVLLRPVYVIERYSDAQIEAWERDDQLSAKELASARKRWGLRRSSSTRTCSSPPQGDTKATRC